MRRLFALFTALAVTVGACAGGDTGETTTTTTSSTTSSTVTTSTTPPQTTSTSHPAPSTTELTSAHPADEDWDLVEVDWQIQPSCCDQPVTGPVSPEIVIPSDDPDENTLAGLEDGFYDVTVIRVSDPPEVLVMEVRQLVSCSDLPDRCSPDAPLDGVVPDSSTEITRTIFMDESMEVVIRTLGDPEGPPNIGIAGSGLALHELLGGAWCGGSLESPTETNCGLDHAFIDWIWDPYQAGTPTGAIGPQIATRGIDADFPLWAFVHEPGLSTCPPDRGCLYAYRGPHGTNFVISPGLAQSDQWPGYTMYGWWTSLEVRDGIPILYIDTAQMAG